MIFYTFYFRLKFEISIDKQKVKNVMKEIGPRNTTNILSGMEIAMKVLSDRKYKNTVTSVFLLGDGLDDHRHSCVADI